MSEVAKECELMKSGETRVTAELDSRDFEVACDSLASWSGVLYSISQIDAREDLKWICEMLYHISAALRKGYCLTDEETKKMIDLGHKYDSYIIKSIVLPISNSLPAGYCHVARTEARKIIVMLRQFEEEIEVDPRLFDVFDSLANYYFGMAIMQTKEPKHKFTSRVY